MNWLEMGVKTVRPSQGYSKRKEKERSADRLVLIEIGHTNRLTS